MAAVPHRDRLLGDRGGHRLAFPGAGGRGVPDLRAGRRGHPAPGAALARADRGRALRGRRHRRAPLDPPPGAPLGGHRRRGLHGDRLADPHLDARAHLAHPDRRRHPRPAAAAVRAGLGRGAHRLVAGHRARAAPGDRRRPAGGRRPGRTGRSRSATRRHDVAVRSPGPPHLAVRGRPCTPSRSARPGSSCPPSSRSSRPPVSAAGRGPSSPLVVGVTLLSLLTAALSWWRFSYVDGPSAVVVTRGLLVPVGAHGAQRPGAGRRGRDAAAAPAVRPGPRAHRRRRRIGRQERGAPGRRRSARRGRPAAGVGAQPPVRRRARRGRGRDGRRGGCRPSRRRRSSPASTTAGCSTRRWSAATSPCRWPPSAPCSGSPTSCRAVSGRASTDPTSPTPGSPRSSSSSASCCSPSGRSSVPPSSTGGSGWSAAAARWSPSAG